MTNQAPSGLDLKLERTAKRVKGTEIARAMGVSRSRVGHIEETDLVSPRTAARYRAALATCVEARTSGEAVA